MGDGRKEEEMNGSGTKDFFRALILLALIIWVVSDSDAHANSKEHDMLMPSAKVTLLGGSGSATAIKADSHGTYLVTAYHVVQRAVDFVHIQFYGEQEQHVAVIHSFNAKKDIAILLTPYKAKYIAKLGRSKKMHVFDAAFCIGSSLGMPLAPSKGIVTQVEHVINGNKYIRTDAGIIYGNSGGGLYVYQDGWVFIGMPTLVASTPVLPGLSVPITFLGMATPITEIRAHLKEHSIVIEKEESEEARSR